LVTKMSKKRRFRVGMEVRVRFLDHVEDGSAPEDFTIYGRIGKVDRKYICIDCWAYTDANTAHDDNVKRFVILRSAIISWSKLVEEQEPVILTDKSRAKEHISKITTPTAIETGRTNGNSIEQTRKTGSEGSSGAR